ncbi:uncharacterized protein LOC114519971 [Dendronephthya gigantea]|uniref:uncharacterized protein LOC114519971 n=1 Tax=Dendronephthya gigantea TaxID=151771 RepID=UPI00106A97DC|nr:uncharacterized protein LOC114519971 [Dendronephthya gigantea]
MSSNEKSGKTKTVHFIRHGESTWNVCRRQLKLSELPQQDRPVLVDAPLSFKGMQQATTLKEKIKNLKPEIAVSSPFTRTLQTCLTSYGSENVIVTALCREFMAATCDNIGLPASCLKVIYPCFDFSSLEETWWYIQDNIKSQPQAVNLLTQGKLVVEDQDQFAARAKEFYKFLCERPEKSIAVYSHNDFLMFFLSEYFGLTTAHISNGEVYSQEMPCTA